MHSFKAGDSPETIRQNVALFDVFIREGEEEVGRSVPPLSESRPELYARLERAKHDISMPDLARH